MEIKNSIDKTRQDKTRQDKTRQDKTRQDNGYACSHECQVVVLGNMDNTIDHTFESANRVYDKNNLCPTIPTCAGGGIQPKIIEETHCVGGLSDGKWGNQYHQPSDEQGAWSYRIRKLTPRSVWRLMGYTDADFEKAASVVSNTQLYKEAGNAIVKQVLMAIFSQMGIKGVKRWNDMSIEERKTLVRGQFMIKQIFSNYGKTFYSSTSKRVMGKNKTDNLQTD